jgi:hypothetical protein
MGVEIHNNLPNEFPARWRMETLLRSAVGPKPGRTLVIRLDDDRPPYRIALEFREPGRVVRTSFAASAAEAEIERLARLMTAEA